MTLSLIQTDFEGRLTEGINRDDAVSRATKRILGWDCVVRTWNRLFDPINDHDEIYDIEGYTINGDEYTGKFYAGAQAYVQSLIKTGKFKSTTVNLISLDPSMKYYYTEKFFTEKAPKVPKAVKQLKHE